MYMLEPGSDSERVCVESVMEEARLQAALRHPFVAKVYVVAIVILTHPCWLSRKGENEHLAFRCCHPDCALPVSPTVQIWGQGTGWAAHVDNHGACHDVLG